MKKLTLWIGGVVLGLGMLCGVIYAKDVRKDGPRCIPGHPSPNCPLR